MTNAFAANGVLLVGKGEKGEINTRFRNRERRIMGSSGVKTDIL